MNSSLNQPNIQQIESNLLNLLEKTAMLILIFIRNIISKEVCVMPMEREFS